MQQLARLRKPLGLPCALRLRIHQIARRLGVDFAHCIRLRPRDVRHGILARAGGRSDLDVFLHIFVDEPFLPLTDITEPKLVLDLGANVGYASIYFLNRFPSARIIAVEPDPENFRVCEQNLSDYSDRVRVLQAAVWSQRTHLVLERGPWDDAVQVREARDGETTAIATVDMPSILELTGGLPVDLLKIDIERSELELFRGNPNRWLPFVRNIAIELHGTECELVFFRALQDYLYDLSFSGELTICRNLRPRK